MERSTGPGLIIRVCIVILLLLAVFNARSLTLGSAQPVSLQPAPALVGAVTQAFTSRAAKTLPVYGTDFRLGETAYFENNNWVVVTVHWLHNQSDDGKVILHQTDGVYRAVLGPGTLFPSTVTQTLPQSVGLYLNKTGLLYDPAD